MTPLSLLKIFPRKYLPNNFSLYASALTLAGFHLIGILFAESSPRFGLLAMIAGTAERPFVYRALTPALVSILPFAPRVAMAAVVLVSLYITLRLISSLQLRFNPWLFVLWILPLMTHSTQLYDMPTLALSAALLWSHVRKRWLLYAVLYVLMCLNKETAILFVLPLLWQWRTTPKALIPFQVLTAAAVRALVTWRFSANPGVTFELNIVYNLLQHANNIELSLLAIIVFGVMLAAAVRNRATVDSTITCTALTLAPAFFILYLVGGIAFEFRVFYELVPAFFLMAQTLQMTRAYDTQQSTQAVS